MEPIKHSKCKILNYFNLRKQYLKNYSTSFYASRVIVLELIATPSDLLLGDEQLCNRPRLNMKVF